MLDDLFHKDSVIPRLTLVACAICLVIFAGLGFVGEDLDWERAQRWGYFPTGVIWEGKPWVLLTSTFVHVEFLHFAFNVYWLWILGNILEDEIGPGWWLLFFLGAAWVSSAAQLLFTGDTGIGMSGVGYALFGFGWVTRPRIRGFAEVLHQQTVAIFLLWLVGCTIATEMGWANIGNYAHFFGLVFGAAAGAVFMQKPNALLPGIGVAALLAASMVPLLWCPKSMEWTTQRAKVARDAKEYDTAIYWFKQARSLGQSDEFVLANLIQIYREKNDTAAMTKAMQELAKLEAANLEEG